MMTRREFCIAVKELDGCTDEMREVADKILASLDKKSSKPTKAQIENEGIKEKIKTYIIENPGHRVGEIAQAVGHSPNKINALIIQLRKAGEIERYEEKGIAYFK